MSADLLAAFVQPTSSWPWGDLVLHLGERHDDGAFTPWAIATRGDQVAFALQLSLDLYRWEGEVFSASIDVDPDWVFIVDDEVVVLTEHYGGSRRWSVVLTRDGVQRARVPGIVDRAHPPRRKDRFLRLQRVEDRQHPAPVAWVDLAGIDVTYGPAAYCAVVFGHRVTQPFRRVGRCEWGHGVVIAEDRPVSFLALPPMDDDTRTRLFEAWGERFSAPLSGVLRSRGWCASVEDGGPWLLAFNARTGFSADTLLRRREPLAADRARRLLEDVATTLDAAHRCGRWHGYLWPGGVFFQEDEAWLRDVGFDRALDALGVAWPPSSPDSPADEPWAWAAPEVLNGGGDARSDVWSFGLLAYHVRTGARYWRSERDGAALRAEILRGPRPRPSVRARRQRLDDITFPDAAFDAWFGRCVVRDPGKRFRGIREACAALPW